MALGQSHMSDSVRLPVAGHVKRRWFCSCAPACCYSGFHINVVTNMRHLRAAGAGARAPVTDQRFLTNWLAVGRG